MAQEKTIKVSDILTDLENGLQRTEIKKKYGFTLKELQTIFAHPKLVGKKAKKQVNLLIIDDTEENQTVKETEELQNEIEAVAVKPTINIVDDLEEGLKSIRKVEENENLEVKETQQNDEELENPFL